MGPIPSHKKANVPTLGPRFPRVVKTIEVKCPTYGRGPLPSRLTLIDALHGKRDGVILLARVANHSAGLDSSWPLSELAIS